MYEKCFYFLLNSSLGKNGVSEEIEAYYLQHRPALQQVFSPHLFICIQKIFSATPI